ncbi:MAG: aspartate aminotransferase family protein [Treponema sp.]|nr:aspartate aminotransferase family protein [Treponema sp.]
MKNLFLTNKKSAKKEYKKIIKQTAKAISRTFSDSSAYSGPTPQELKDTIRGISMLPETGLGWEQVLAQTEEKILPNMLRTSSPDYMPHLHSPATLESIASELIISTFNQSMDSWDQAPVATEIEVEVIRQLCQLYGYPKKSDGVFTSGGSQSNQTAIILARDWFITNIMNYDVKKHGLPENFRKLRMYTSEISHFSMEKSAHILGLGYESVVKVPVDSRKRIDFAALERLVEEDVAAGNIPFLAVATIGTTDFGSIDPVDKIARLCKKHNMWLHADAAYGSGVVLSQKYADKVASLHKCDSITVDFHKMFLLPISCSAVLVKNGADFDALTIHADYLNREEDEEDGYTNLVDKSLQTTRRFDALKVWMSFQARGKDGWSKIITSSMENARSLYSIIKQNENFELITEPEISSVVFRYKAEDDTLSDDINRKVRRALLHEHGIVIGQTVSNGHVCLKFTLLNPLMTHQKLEALVTLIQTIASNN